MEPPRSRVRSLPPGGTRPGLGGARRPAVAVEFATSVPKFSG